MPKKDFTIIIVNYNTPILSLQTLETLYRTHRGENFEVILVDNNSNEDTKKKLRDYFVHHHFPNLEIVWSEENLGFGRGNNLGVKKAHELWSTNSDYLLFLNSDTILKQNILAPLKNAFAADENLQILSPLLRLENGDIQPFLAGDFATLARTILRKNKDAREKISTAKSTPLLTVDWVSGCALAIKRQQFEKLGGFATDYFMYFEDIDLCKKNALAGATTALLTSAEITHLGGKSVATLGARKNLYFASQDIFWRKYHHPLSCLALKFLRAPYQFFTAVRSPRAKKVRA